MFSLLPCKEAWLWTVRWCPHARASSVFLRARGWRTSGWRRHTSRLNPRLVVRRLHSFPRRGNMAAVNVRAALYARVSSERQAKDNTIASQVASLRERIAADGLAL